MPAKAKSKAPERHGLTAIELADFKLLHAELELAQEKAAHFETAAKLLRVEHELQAHQQSAAHNAAMRNVAQLCEDRKRDVAKAKTAAAGFAETISNAYAVDLKAHAVNPLTGEFIRLNEGTHG